MADTYKETSLSLTARMFSLLATVVLLAGLAALGLALAAALGYRFGAIDLGLSFQLLRYGIYAAFVAVAFGLFVTLVLLVRSPKAGLVSALIGTVCGAGLLGMIVPQIMTARSVPAIHDVTTDTDNPPDFVAIRPLRDDAPNPPDYVLRPECLGEGTKTVPEFQREAYPDIETLTFDEAPGAVFARAEQAVRDLGWDLVAVVEEEGRIEASETSLWFGFTDDVVIRIRAASGGGTELDIRSKSRVGCSDIGMNAKRIRAFLERMGA